MAEREEVALPDITASALLINDLHIESGIPARSIIWEDVVRAELASDQSYSYDDLPNINAFSSIAKAIIGEKKAGALVEANYSNVRLILGGIVKSISLRMALKMEEQQYQLIQIRGAINAFKMLPDCLEQNKSSNIDSAVALAIWTMGMLKVRNDTIRPHSSDQLTRTGKRILSDEYRWVSGLQEYRIKDLKYLLQENEGTKRAVLEIINWNSIFPAEIEAVVVAQRRATGGDPESLAEKRILEIWPRDSKLFWHSLNEMTPTSRGVLGSIDLISGDRGDVLVVGDEALVSEPQGIMDSFLTFCTDRAGDHRNQQWHEREVAKAIRGTWKDFAQILENVEWVQSLAKPDLETFSVESEIDVLVKSKDLLLSFQAKSARSSKSKQREKTTIGEAMKQHRVFNDSLNTGAWAVKRNRSTGKYKIHPRIGNMSIPERVHIPVTVGAENVHLWSVGSSALEEEFPRVLTTLDHMRVVNFYIPKWFSPVYWADRYAQEFSALKFIDEIDFLGKWANYLRSDGNFGKFEIYGQWVMSTASEIEESMAIRNTVLPVTEARNAFNSPVLLADLARFEYRNFSISYPKINELFEEVSRVSKEDCVLLARAMLGNPLGSVERALEEEECSVFHAGIGRLVVHFESTDMSKVLEKVPDCFVLLQKVSGRWKMSRVAATDAVANSWKTPRFSLPDENGGPVQYGC